MLNNITVYHYLILALILFCIGLCGVVIAKNIIKVLISLELMLCAVNINLVAFGLYSSNTDFDGYIFSLFYIAIGAIEVAIALYIFKAMYKKNNSANVEDYKEL